jgi:hypothetical protein
MLLLTEFYMDYEALFNCFLQEKNINLLILHQNLKWCIINAYYSLSKHNN